MAEIDNEVLIHLIQEKPVLWDKTLDTFKDRNATRNAWHEVCLQLRTDFDQLEESKKNDFGKEVMKRWKHLRDAFIKSRKKYRATKGSGSQASKIKKYIFNDELQFLQKIYKERVTEETYGDDDNNNEELSITPSVTAETAILKDKVPRRQVRKMDEVDLKILQAIQHKEHEAKNEKLLFFESLLPHVQKFDDNQWLQCQIEFLQVISKVRNSCSTPQNLNVYNTSHYQQYHESANTNFTHPRTVPHMAQSRPTTTFTTSNFQQFPNASQPKSCTQHYQNFSQIIIDDNVLSHTSSATNSSSPNSIDFAEL